MIFSMTILLFMQCNDDSPEGLIFLFFLVFFGQHMIIIKIGWNIFPSKLLEKLAFVDKLIFYFSL